MTVSRTLSAPAHRRTLAALFGVFLFLVSACVSGLPESFRDLAGQTQYLVNDDSMITLRVVKHISQGFGPYFNVGEHVAANTSTIWPFLMTPAFWLCHDPGRCVLLLSLLTTLLMAATIVVAALSAETWFEACGIAATLLIMPCFGYFGPTAWEHVPQTLLITIAFLVLLGRLPSFRGLRIETALVFTAIAFLMRPDTMPLLFVLAAATIWQIVKYRELRAARAGALVFAVAAAAFYYSLQHHLYGDFVPNTYYLKVSLGIQSIHLGLRYLWVSALDSGIPLLLAGAMFLRLRRRPGLTLEEKVIFVAVLAQVAYIVIIGGDIFHYGRFFMMLGPLAAILLWREAKVLLIAQSPEAAPAAGEPVYEPVLQRGAGVGTAVVVASLLFVVCADMVRVVRNQKWSERVWTYSGSAVVTEDLQDQAIMAPYLRSRLTPADGQIGIFTLGALPYYMPEYSFADFLGKADPVIAHEKPKWGATGHNKWDFEYSLHAHHVSVVPFILLPEATAQAWVAEHAIYSGDAPLQLDPYMRANYSYRSPAQLGLPGPYGLLIRNDLLARFPSSSAGRGM